jgi:hypothetical protein
MEQIHQARMDAMDAALETLKGSTGEDCRVLLPDEMDDASKIIDETRDLLNEGLNKEGMTIPDRVSRYQTAFGLCSAAKARSMGRGDRVKAAAAWLGTVTG